MVGMVVFLRKYNNGEPDKSDGSNDTNRESESNPSLTNE